MALAPEVDLLLRLARAVAPDSARFVVIGGAAQQLFRLTQLAQPVDFGTLRTNDADVSSSSRAEAMRVDERFESLGFRAEPSGEDTPPRTRYVLESRPTHFVQFVTHRTGSVVKRGGRRDATVVIAGAVAEKLSHIDLLLALPWTVALDQHHGFPTGSERLELRLANAASYLAQKLLVLREREPDGRAKDLAYIHDTLLIFAPALGRLADLWRDVEPASSKRSRDVVAAAHALSARSSDDIRRAVRLLRSLDRPDAPDEHSMLNVLRSGLSALFGGPDVPTAARA